VRSSTLPAQCSGRTRSRGPICTWKRPAHDAGRATRSGLRC
jgi:hypothetical protein